MIGTLTRIAWISLKRDRAALVLTFVLPIIFFSIFAVIFSNMGGGGGDGLRPLNVIGVDLDDSEVSRRLLDTLGREEAIDMTRVTDRTRDEAANDVRTGAAHAAIIIPAGFSDTFPSFGGDDGAGVEVVYDESNLMAQFTVTGLLQAASFQAAPDMMMERGMGYLDELGIGFTSEQQSLIDEASTFLRDTAADTTSGDGDGFGGLVAVTATPARSIGAPEEEEPSNSIVAYYAAGIGVMFLLFSMAGAAGGLLEEEESGTLDRILSTRVPMSSLLTSRWLFFAALGFLQVILMFVWGALVFGLDLWTPNHLAGCIAMALVTSAAAAAFGVLLATVCKSRAQLSGLSTVVILIMSAIGGSMVPRFVMPPFMDTASKFTFNGWALDGFLKVFWYDDPSHGVARSLATLAPQIGVLAALTVVFLLIARHAGRRWETI